MIIAVTNRRLCKENFYRRIERLYKAGTDRIILREKDLDEREYMAMAKKCYDICGDKLYINSRCEAARKTGIKNIHLPADRFERDVFFKNCGASVHSVSEAVLMEEKGADYIIAGHIFATDCKKDLPPRGVDFLKSVTEAVTVPVYAIGGITPETAGFLKGSGIKGVCLMSGLMASESPERIIDFFKNISYL